MHEHRIRRKVEYVDTDMSGIVHFSRFLVYMENTEHAFLRAIGTDVHFEDEGRAISWPRGGGDLLAAVGVLLRLSGPRPLRRRAGDPPAGDRKGTRSLTYGFEISRGG